MGKKEINLEETYVENELLLGLQNSIIEVEKLLIRTIRERNILANKFSDEDQTVIALTNYAEQLIQTLHRTNLYYYDQLAQMGEKTVYNAVVAKMDEQIKQNNKNLKKAIDYNLGWEIESYFEEKNKIARCFKNLFSQSDLTVKKKNNELNELFNMYGFSYSEGSSLPDCPILPLSSEEDNFKWENGFALIVPGSEPLTKPIALPYIPENEYKYYFIIGPKPVIPELIDVNLDDDIFEK